MLLIDHYDTFAASGPAPLGSLLPYPAPAGDSCLHVVMTQLIRPGEPVEHVQTAYAARSEARAP